MRIRPIWSAAILLTLTNSAVLPVAAQTPPRGRTDTRPGNRPRPGTALVRQGRVQISLATIPVPVLDLYLKLTDNQKKKIKAIEDKYQTDVRGLGPIISDSLQGGPRIDAQAIQDVIRKRVEIGGKATSAIEAELTSDQKSKLADMRTEIAGLRTAGIPVQAIPELKLTSDQKKKLADIAADNRSKLQAAFQSRDMEKIRSIQQEGRQKTQAVLTAEQKKAVEKYPQQFTRGRRAGRP